MTKIFYWPLVPRGILQKDSPNPLDLWTLARLVKLQIRVMKKIRCQVCGVWSDTLLRGYWKLLHLARLNPKSSPGIKRIRVILLGLMACIERLHIRVIKKIRGQLCGVWSDTLFSQYPFYSNDFVKRGKVLVVGPHNTSLGGLFFVRPYYKQMSAYAVKEP